ncbi:MAG: MBL fold metallo-hydrolase [Nanoarchaeota archaeon]|nr:MBL fold metallo-hydrolase [Nanoarchaeota archaeon]
MKIQWLGHSSFKIKAGHKIIYIDPYAGEDYTEKADIVLVSHAHYDHSSREKITQIRVDDTIVLTTKDNVAAIDGESFSSGDTRKIEDITITAIPAYNLEKEFHPKENPGLGFIIRFDGKSVYHAADTDMIPEMKDLRPTVALLPVGGIYTMNAKEAAIAAERIMPHIVIPMHYGAGIVGKIDDAELFKELVEINQDITARILKEGEEIEI